MNRRGTQLLTVKLIDFIPLNFTMLNASNLVSSTTDRFHVCKQLKDYG